VSSTAVGPEVLLQVGDALGAGDRDDVVALGEDPGEGQLAGGAAVALGEALDLVDEAQVRVEGVTGEPREPADGAGVAGLERVRGDGAGEHAAAERGVRHQADAEPADRRQDLVLEVAGEQRPLALEGGDRVHGVGATDRVGGGFGEAQVADLARLDELLHRADGLLDRDRGVHAVLVVEVDVVDTEALERGVAGGADVRRAAVDADPAAVGVALVAELGGELDLVAAAGDRLADELLVGEGPVHVGRVEEGDAQVEGAVDGPDAGGLVAGAVELRHPHAAEAEGGDLEGRVRTESASLSGHAHH